jgi:uncharacterized protein YndB with AHSA1/START domain
MTGPIVTVRKMLPATCEEVFDAWLDADGMREWMCPGPVTHSEVSLDPRVGGRFCIVMKAAGFDVVNTGEFRVLARPIKLQFAWVSTRWGPEETLVTIELHARGAGCELVLTHERFPADYSRKELEGGWGQIVAKLGSVLAPRR